MARGSLSLFERLFSSKKKRDQLSTEHVAQHPEGSAAAESAPVSTPAVPPAAAAQAAAPAAAPAASEGGPPTGVPADTVAAPGVALSESPAAVAPATVATPAAVETPPAAVEEAAFAGSSDAGPASMHDPAPAGMPGAAEAVAPTAGPETGVPGGEEQDTQLEYDSMVLLSKLEQLVIRLSDNSVQKSMPLVIEAMGELLNHLAEFSEQLPVAENQKLSLSALIERDAQNYTQLRPDFVQNNRLVLGDAEAGFGQDPAAFQQISNDILRVSNVYLSASVKAFSSPRVGEQWKTLYTGFFVNLSKAVRSAQDTQLQQ